MIHRFNEIIYFTFFLNRESTECEEYIISLEQYN